MLSHVWTHPAILDSHHSNHPAVSQGCFNIGESKPQEGQCGHFTSFCVSTQFSPCIWPWFGVKSVSNAKNNIYIYIYYWILLLLYIYVYRSATRQKDMNPREILLQEIPTASMTSTWPWLKASTFQGLLLPYLGYGKPTWPIIICP